MLKRVRGILQNAVLLTVTLSLGLVGLEFAWRATNGYDLFSWKNYIEEKAFGNRMGTVVYDPELGWRTPDFLDYGPLS